MPCPKSRQIKLIATAPHEAFFTYMKVAFLAGIMLAVPVILYQLWCFIAPGLYEKERRAVLPVVFFSSLFFLGGASFGYFCVFPYGFPFFASFATDYITPMITTREFLTLHHADAVRLRNGFRTAHFCLLPGQARPDHGPTHEAHPQGRHHRHLHHGRARLLPAPTSFPS